MVLRLLAGSIVVSEGISSGVSVLLDTLLLMELLSSMSKYAESLNILTKGVGLRTSRMELRLPFKAAALSTGELSFYLVKLGKHY